MFINAIRRVFGRGDRETPSAPAGHSFWAFISYSHADEAWARWLHQALEQYRLPKGLIGKTTPKGVVPKRLRPVFRDRDELPGSPSLKDEIGRALEQSRSLVVICSPHSAVSRYVNEETLTFKRLGREDEIYCLLVGGEPNASDRPDSGLLEAFPRAIRFRAGPDGALGDERAEPLAADVRRGKDARHSAKLKLIAGILGIGFDDLKQREVRRQRQQRLQMAGVALAVLLVIGGVWWNRQLAIESQRQIALAQRLIDQSTELLASEDADALQRGVLLILQAMARLDRPRVNVASDGEAAQARLAADMNLRRALAIFYTPTASLAAFVPREYAERGWTSWRAEAVAFSPDGQSVTAASSWGSRPQLAVRRWNVETGGEIQHLARGLTREDFNWPTVTDRINRQHFALSPDGEYLAAVSAMDWAGEPNIAIVFHGGDNREIARLGFNGRIRGIALGPRGEHLAIAADTPKGTPLPLQLWHVPTARAIAGLPAATELLTACEQEFDSRTPCPPTLAFSPDGRFIAFAGDRITLWTLPTHGTGEPVRPGPDLKLYRGATVAFSPDGRFLAGVGSVATSYAGGKPYSFGERVIRVWDVSDGREVASVPSVDAIRRLALGAGAKHLAIVDNEHSLSLRALTNGSMTRVYFTPDKQRSASMKLQGKGPGARGNLADAVFGPRDDLLAMSGEVDAIVVRVSSFDEQTVVQPDRKVVDVAFSADERMVASINWTDDKRTVTVREWDVETGRELTDRRRDHVADVYKLSANGHLIAATDDQPGAGVGGAVTVHGDEAIGPLRYEGSAERVFTSQDGQHLAIASIIKKTGTPDRQQLTVWNLATRSEVLRFEYPTTEPGGGRPDAFFILDDRWYFGYADLIINRDGGSTSTFKLWELKSRRAISERTDEMMLQLRSDVATSADRRWLGVEVNDEVKIFAANGPEIARMRIPSPDADPSGLASRFVAVSPQGRYVAAITAERTVRIWPVAPSRLIEIACSRLTRDLTPEEWKGYLPTERPTSTCKR